MHCTRQLSTLLLIITLLGSSSVRLSAADEAILTVARPELNLGAVRVGSEHDTTFSRVFINESSDTVFVTGIRVFGSNGTIRSTFDHEGAIVPPGGGLDLMLAFRPTEVAPFWATVRVETTTDIDPWMTVYGAGAYAEPNNGLSVIDPVFLGNVPLGTTLQVPLYDALANVGFVDLRIDTMYVAGDYASSYYLETMPTFPLTLPSGGVLPVSLVFMASDNAVHNARLVVKHGDTTTSIPIIGVGGYLADPFLVRIEGREGTIVDTTITFRHLSQTSMTVNSVDGLHAPFTILETRPSLPATLAGYEDLEVRIRMATDTPGTALSAVRVTWRDPEGDIYFVARRVLRGHVTPSTGVDDDLHSTPMIDVVPNPASEQLSIRTDAGSIQSYTLRDLRGHTVRTAMITMADSAEVDVADLAPGVYILSVQTPNGTAVRSIVIER